MKKRKNRKIKSHYKKVYIDPSVHAIPYKPDTALNKIVPFTPALAYALMLEEKENTK